MNDRRDLQPGPPTFMPTGTPLPMADDTIHPNRLCPPAVSPWTTIAQLEKDLAVCREEIREDHDTLRNFLRQETGREGEIKRPIGAAIAAWKILKDRADKAEQERDALRIALIDALKLLDQADFRNGNTEPTGTLDEGEVLASQWIHDIRKALKP